MLWDFSKWPEYRGGHISGVLIRGIPLYYTMLATILNNNGCAFLCYDYSYAFFFVAECIPGFTDRDLTDFLRTDISTTTHIILRTNVSVIAMKNEDAQSAYWTLLNEIYHALFGRRETITDIWSNKPPCPSCASALLTASQLLGGSLNPTLHIETMVDTGNILQNMGCVNKLKSTFTIVLWDWNEFIANVGMTLVSCTQHIMTATSEASYIEKMNTTLVYNTIMNQLRADTTINDYCR